MRPSPSHSRSPPRASRGQRWPGPRAADRVAEDEDVEEEQPPEDEGRGAGDDEHGADVVGPGPGAAGPALDQVQVQGVDLGRQGHGAELEEVAGLALAPEVQAGL